MYIRVKQKLCISGLHLRGSLSDHFSSARTQEAQHLGWRSLQRGPYIKRLTLCNEVEKMKTMM